MWLWFPITLFFYANFDARIFPDFFERFSFLMRSSISDWLNSCASDEVPSKSLSHCSWVLSTAEFEVSSSEISSRWTNNEINISSECATGRFAESTLGHVHLLLFCPLMSYINLTEITVFIYCGYSLLFRPQGYQTSGNSFYHLSTVEGVQHKFYRQCVAPMSYLHPLVLF